ncbi:MAG TPA: MFS transporter, partial [Gammaproteobacteria bacterium]
MALTPTTPETMTDAPDGEGHAGGVKTRPWPSEASGYFALAAIVFATFIAFLDQTAFGLLAEKMKVSFGMSDFVLGLMLGPVTVVAYVIVGIPLARLVDIYPRKYVLSIGIAALGMIMVLGGLAQNLWQLVTTRLFVGASGSAHGPGCYSMLVDYFRPARIPVVFALLQLGFIFGLAFGNILGGQMIAWTNSLGETVSLFGIEIFS